MKNKSFGSKPAASIEKNSKTGSCSLLNPNFSSKVLDIMVTEHVVIPPASVWERIEKTLDEQDVRRKHAESLIKSSFSATRLPQKNFVLLAVACCSVLASLYWKLH